MRVMINFSPGYCAADLFLFSPFKLVEVNKKMHTSCTYLQWKGVTLSNSVTEESPK